MAYSSEVCSKLSDVVVNQVSVPGRDSDDAGVEVSRDVSKFDVVPDWNDDDVENDVVSVDEAVSSGISDPVDVFCSPELCFVKSSGEIGRKVSVEFEVTPVGPVAIEDMVGKIEEMVDDESEKAVIMFFEGIEIVGAVWFGLACPSCPVVSELFACSCGDLVIMAFVAASTAGGIVLTTGGLIGPNVIIGNVTIKQGNINKVFKVSL